MTTHPKKKGNPAVRIENPVVIVTGLSGAGLSTAIRALQDSGYYCIDNLPMEMLWDALKLVESGKIVARGFAFGMDIRDASFATKFPQLKKTIADRFPLDVLFLDADPDILLRRYGSTRRRHPLVATGSDLADAIKRESEFLRPVEDSADAIIDTSHLTPKLLARVIEDRYAGQGRPLRSLFVTITSFGFKYGPLLPADSIQDVRFLTNPFFIPELKHKTGLDRDVQDFVMSDKIAQETFKKLDDLYRFLLPQYFQEGKHYFRLGIGCTGGQHRSVTFAEELAKSLLSTPLARVIVSVVHRDLGE